MIVTRPRYLLTGGIGSGKSSAGAVFADLGATLISADEVGHAVLIPGGESFEAVAGRFPDSVVDGWIDRARLAARVFSDPLELAALEEITHPAIRARILSQVDRVAGAVLVEVPLPGDFLGAGWGRIVVDAPVEIRVARLVAAGLRMADVESRMAVQPERGEWLAIADYVVDNRGDHAALRRECLAVWERIAAPSLPPSGE